MPYCDDCGCYMTSAGICSNCHEELYITEYQSEYADAPYSDEFLAEAGRQRREVDAKVGGRS